jgi:short subunit dehydrogenase-like uncharacterized protein
MPEPDLSILILGATGVTGRQAVRYMRERGPQLGVRWGIGGRDEARLAALIDEFEAEARPEILRVDVDDATSVNEAVARAKVVVNFAGPFARMAPNVIEACVRAGRGYLDVTGEMDFAADTVNRHHDAAVASGARIVQVAGYEALPFDLAAALGIDRLTREHGGQPTSIDVVVDIGVPGGGMPRFADSVSNGTFESLREAIARNDSGVIGDPAGMIGGLADPDAVRRASPIRNRPRRAPDGRAIGPMIPSPIINPPVIQRSLALAGIAPIPYREGVVAPGTTKLVQGLVAGAAGAMNGGLALVLRAPAPVRRAAAAAMKPLAPPGGPREDQLEAWTWSVDCVVSGSGRAEASVRIEADGHPGYLATSRITTEAGLILADPDATTPGAAGCLTPAAALGIAEIDRFAVAGMRFVE